MESSESMGVRKGVYEGYGGLAKRIPSVRLSVKCVICDKTKENSARIYTT